MKVFYLFSLMMLLFSCKDPDAALRSDLDGAVFKIDMLENQLAAKKSVNAGDLIHHVYLNIKDDLSTEEVGILVEELNKLKGISELKSFSLGKFKQLEDSRAMSEFEIVLSISFENEAGYSIYQDHPIHQKLKRKLDKYLSAAPVTYDYIHQ